MRKIECISVFDMLKVGVGPSSSHTLGPWRAAQRWIAELKKKDRFEQVEKIHVDLYGSLSLTGKGHATDIATLLGLLGHDPVTMDISILESEIERIRETGKLSFNGERDIDFSIAEDVKFNRKFLEFHPNGMTFRACLDNGKKTSSSFYSIGGGFVVKKERKNASKKMKNFQEFPFPVEKATELLAFCKSENKTISEIVLENERSLRTDEQIEANFKQVWDVMLESMYIGCHTEGTLPGGLNVKRRAFEMHQRLIGDTNYTGIEDWIPAIRQTEVKFRQILKWVSCFALSVNEVNASLGRVVTAPTNGSAGTVPAVMMYYMCIENHEATFEDLKRFMLVAGEIGSLFKKGATISAAMGGCQAEIGVSSAMAAGGLTELMGGTPEQVLMASEIAMEHHLGLTCDPIAGLVQVPCIERNAMGAIKAINAAEIAMESDASKAKVPLDKVIETMWETAKDMNKKYKETSEGGLAVKVSLSDC
ncbi:L-serine ammonia-lyase [Pontixanthobacter gangjinensis]|uniref:L-serine dehydratase n=1 Tax=Christiangramia aestuarii TaxID=1028746 RepID=A0A7M3SWZ7_9FLAO|nr:L-serine ammonia-lyase [Christiangramia aestuarii]MUP41128.1 L-serine ammonia-lyase [Christiangramia aestuarii]